MDYDSLMIITQKNQLIQLPPEVLGEVQFTLQPSLNETLVILETRTFYRDSTYGIAFVYVSSYRVLTENVE